MDSATFTQQLQDNPIQRTRFFADVLNVFEKHGVEINEQILTDLGLDQNLVPNGGLAASSQVVTITQ